MTVQQEYAQSSATLRSAFTEVTGELNTRQAEVAEQIKQDEAAFAALTKELTESTVDEPAAPVRRPEDNDISASAEAYQERDEEEPTAPPPVTPRPVARRTVEDEEVPSFQWDEDPPPAPARPAAPAKRERARHDEDEDLSEHDWLE